MSDEIRAAKGVRLRLNESVCLLILMVGLWGSEGITRCVAADEPNPRALFAERQAEREAMLETQMSGPGRTPITDQRVLRSMRTVPRHLFIPEENRGMAYQDSPVPIGYGQTISQPYIVALMTQALGLEPGMNVLEVGTGSGYQAAVLAEITPHVYSIEIIEPLWQRAQGVWDLLGYDSITSAHGDGYFGMPKFEPFDRIIVTCAALHVPPPLFAQLKPGGKMVIPVGGRFETQRLLLVTKTEDSQRRSRTLELVRFVPLIREDPTD
jgi:protein-L-isoaspartate(D-aspartate) O-methyltransferase